jgi:hypothetical protein
MGRYLETVASRGKYATLIILPISPFLGRKMKQQELGYAGTMASGLLPDC